MRILLAKRFPATALRNQVLSSALTIPTGVAFDRSGVRHTVRITGESLCGGSRRFNSDNVGAVDPSWVRRVTGVAASASEPQVGGGEPAITAEEGSVPVPVKEKRKRSRRAKEKSDDAPLPFTPPTGAKVDTFECMHPPPPSRFAQAAKLPQSPAIGLLRPGRSRTQGSLLKPLRHPHMQSCWYWAAIPPDFPRGQLSP